MDLAVRIRQSSYGNGREFLFSSLKRAVLYLTGSKSTATAILLTSALVVTTARLLAPFEVGTDQAIQLEAAQRFSQGMGLTTTSDADHFSHDLAKAPTPARLVQFPPGFSLIVAVFLLSGLSLLTSLKMLYGLSTLVGWFGWTIIARNFAPKTLPPLWKRLRLHYLFAALLPIFYSPLWKGTDLFLWAGIPFFVLLLWKASSTKLSWKLLLGAGLLFTILCAIRYASLFLIIAAVLVLFQNSYPNIAQFAKRLIVFLLPSLLLGTFLIAYVRTTPKQSSGLPTEGGVTQGKTSLPQKIRAMINGSPVTSTLVFGTPIVTQVVSQVNSRLFNYAVGITCLVFVGLLPIFVKRNWGDETSNRQKTLAISLSLFPLSLAIFLMTIRLINDASLFGIKRYYEPLSMCGLLLFYHIASRPEAHRVARGFSEAVIILFLGYTILFSSLSLMVPERREQLVQSVFGFTPAKSLHQHSTSQDLHLPSWQAYTWKESSREAVKELYRTNPDALFIAQQYPLFVYDGLAGNGPIPGRQIIDYPGLDYISHAHTSKPLKVFWVVASTTKMGFVDPTKLTLVHSDPIENTRIYESNLPAGYQFVRDSE